MAEVIARRFARLSDGTGETHDASFATAPNLVVIDGGKGQLNAALDALAELGLPEITAVGLAKRFEEVYQPGESEPVRIPRGSDALYLLQHVRDEAHRFAITYHRTLRGKKTTQSALDRIPGIGPKRKRELLRAFGSVRRILQASEEELATVVPADVARRIIPILRGLEPGLKE
jgi:excinuclease ABC subunit C